jgi:hypothetical protein
MRWQLAGTHLLALGGLLVLGGTIVGLYLHIPRVWLPLIWVGPLLLLAIVWHLRARTWRRAQFAGREILNDDEIFDHFFTGANLSKRLVLLQWHNVARAVHVAPGKLRPTDRFDRELGTMPGWELWDYVDASRDALLDTADRRLKEVGSSVVLSELDTLEKFVRCMAAIEGGSPQPPVRS